MENDENDKIDSIDGQYIVCRINPLKPYSTKLMGTFQNKLEAIEYVKNKTRNGLKFEIHNVKDVQNF